MYQGLLAEHDIQSNTDTDEMLPIHWKYLQKNAHLLETMHYIGSIYKK